MSRFKVGETVHHFTNVKAVAEVVAVFPPRDCGKYGMGNQLPCGAFMAVALVTVRYPNGIEKTTFEIYYKPLAKGGR